MSVVSVYTVNEIDFSVFCASWCQNFVIQTVIQAGQWRT